MSKFIFALYNLDTKKVEGVYYTAESFEEALDLMENDCRLEKWRFIIEDYGYYREGE